MTVIISILFWFLGFFIGAFTIIPVCICLFFALPFTRSLDKKGLLKNKHPLYKNYLMSIVSLSFIYIAVLLLIKYFGSIPTLQGFIGGTIFSLIMGIWKTGGNKVNREEYMDKNKEYFRPEEETKV